MSTSFMGKAVFEALVNSLRASGLNDAAIARQIVDEVHDVTGQSLYDDILEIESFVKEVVVASC